MPRHPSPLPRRTRRLPRKAWLALLVIGCVAAFFVIRHYRDRRDTLPAFSDRPMLLGRAQTALRADPSIADVTYSSAHDQWDVTPALPDTHPRDFARYVCFLLDHAAVAEPDTSVRVIDGAKLKATNLDYAAASRGTTTCGDMMP
jgi:hypothetical protein